MNVLHHGSHGETVQLLQRLLNEKLCPRPNLKIDGHFGAKTAAAVRRYQSVHALGIDGIVGPHTWRALESGAHPVSTKHFKVPVSSAVAPWIHIAEKEVGVSEIAGAKHNPRILQYHASTSLKATSDETPWCSSFVNWVITQAGFSGTNSASACSWLHWSCGDAVATKTGAIAVIFDAAANRNLSTSGNHVGFLVRDDPKYFYLLGGNQRDQVMESKYPKSEWTLKGCRWPRALR